MARLPRLAIDGQLHHLIHHARPGSDVFGLAADCQDFLSALLEVTRRSQIALHAYLLLPERCQLLFTPPCGADVASMMQRLGRRFVGSFNRRHGSTGSPWVGRYRTSVLQAAPYALAAMRHVERCPVTLGVVNRPEEWPASSASHHLGLRNDPLVTDHPMFWALGNTPFEREGAYRQFLDDAPGDGTIGRHIDEATEKGWALGSMDFIEHLSARQARRLLPARRGRPKRSVVSDPI